MGHDVFLSYSSKDRKAAEDLCRALEKGNVRVWMAPRNLAPSSTWAEAIPSAIDASRLVLLVFSEHVNASEWVSREIQHAVHAKKRVMPVRLSEVKPASSLSFYLSTLHWLDAFPGPLQQHLPGVTRHCQTLLSVRSDPKAAPQRPLAGAKPPAKGETAPAPQRSVALMAAAVGAVALAATLAGAAWLFATSQPSAAVPDGTTAQSLASSAPPTDDCSLPYGSRLLDANLGDFELPSSQPLSGGYSVVDVATLKINDNVVVKLAGVGRGDARGAESLRKWLENSGPIVICRPADERRCHYSCINEDGQDVSRTILSSHWAAAAASAVSSQN